MPPLHIRATFPLGTYLGHRDVGHRSGFPDTARLHSALWHAAGTGSSAETTGAGLCPNPEAVAALRWLEEHPPTSIAHPRIRPVARRSPNSWRNEGVRDKKGVKKRLKHQSDAMAVDGPFCWSWDDAPAEILGTIDMLCADVSCLGEADSPVVLDLVAVAPTLSLDPSTTAFPAPGGTPIRTPQPGRGAELVAAHTQAHPTRRPTIAADESKTDESPLPAPVPAGRLRELVYRPMAGSVSACPWPTVVLLPVTGRAVDRIRVAVATHRALIARLGEAPSLVTGKYAPNAQQPANRLAIQYLDHALVAHRGLDTAAIALLIPAGADAAELAVVDRAVRGLSRIYAGDGVELTVKGAIPTDAEQFWPAVPAGHARFWRPLPSLVPETRRQRSAQATPQWTLAEAAKLSIGYVLRDQLDQEQCATRAGLVNAVTELGVKVYETRALAESNPGRHAHKVPEGMIVFPYTALLDLHTVLGPLTLAAAGQSRHLGGGLLVPEDVLIPLAQARGLLA